MSAQSAIPHPLSASVLTAIGVALTLLALGWMLATYWRRPHVRSFPHYGYLGLAVIGIAEILLFRGREPLSTFFTPIVWTGYIAVMDAAVLSLRGESLIHDRGREFLAAAALSAPFWLVFEAYNLRLANWAYIGLPANPVACYFGYAWAFTTIWPAMLETAGFFRAAGLWQREYTVLRLPAGLRLILAPLGAVMLVAPLVVPRALAAYLFGLVWLGFIFVLDPWNSRLGASSLLDDVARGRRDRLYSLLASGAVCGILWEFWNFWATGKWIYIFPILQGAKIFEMPVPGYLGFPPFAVEYFCMAAFLAALVRRAGGHPRLGYAADF